ncbi:hypothetical protein QLG13_18085 [Rhodococcus aetherivorans]|uniref:hypothetical protein n=1 Tax=Rhodococcus aetherivorans TaxID=191292 RepID=UPI0012DDB178|nr:hypothetical protein [Rhodococcus aetherivorans]
MWLPQCELSPTQVLEEFDQWVTPTLGDIRETDKFQQELESLYKILSRISRNARSGISHRAAVQAEVDKAFAYMPDSSLAEQHLASLLSFVYLATAKSDNAIKCQYPIAYRREFGDDYPRVTARGIARATVPTVLKSTDVVSGCLRLHSLKSSHAEELLKHYIDFLLAGANDISQVSTLVDSFTYCEELNSGSGRNLLAPLVAFQVRGSVAATGGHNPEARVRSLLSEWGMLPGKHFNTGDVTAQALAAWLSDFDPNHTGPQIVPSNTKTRAFDFIIPYQEVGVSQRIFIQSQFYAGDSGSVSHKNVDQAAGARMYASQLFPTAKFVELVDGAGYCASLRKDLQHLIFAADTDGFFQLRSVPVRLRRLMQEAQTFSPLDAALLVWKGVVNSTSLRAELLRKGALPDCVDQLLQDCISRDWLVHDGKKYSISADKTAILQRYAIIDLIAEQGGVVQRSSPRGSYALIPGYGPNFGLHVSELDVHPLVLTSLIDEGFVSLIEVN